MLIYAKFNFKSTCTKNVTSSVTFKQCGTRLKHSPRASKFQGEFHNNYKDCSKYQRKCLNSNWCAG